MNKKTSVTMAAAIAVAGILTLAVLAVAIPHQAFAASSNACADPQDKKQQSNEIAIGGNGGSGGAGGAGGEGGAGGVNIVKTSASLSSSGSIDQKANGGDANGGHGGNANGGDAST
ncbi:MAG: hypothetical protein WAM42_25840 [Candidatus Nitrosopolaris sp.]|jgi:hypothetical protein